MTSRTSNPQPAFAVPRFDSSRFATRAAWADCPAVAAPSRSARPASADPARRPRKPGAHSAEAHDRATRIEIPTAPTQDIRPSVVADREQTRPVRASRGSHTCCHRRSRHHRRERHHTYAVPAAPKMQSATSPATTISSPGLHWVANVAIITKINAKPAAAHRIAPFQWRKAFIRDDMDGDDAANWRDAHLSLACIREVSSTCLRPVQIFEPPCRHAPRWRVQAPTRHRSHRAIEDSTSASRTATLIDGFKLESGKSLENKIKV